MLGKKHEELKEKIRELESVIDDLNQEISELNNKITNYKDAVKGLEADIDSITKLKDATPEDCKQGEWCKSCEFAKVYWSRSYCSNGLWRITSRYLCGKGESCKNFVQCKEEQE